MKHYKPTTPQRRHLTVVDYSVLSRVKPLKKLTQKLKAHSGRNSQGRITTRHQGGGVKKLYRKIDFKQNKMDVPGRVETLEYDPYRTCFIMRVVFGDGERRYMIAPHGIKAGDTVLTSYSAPLEPGNRVPLKNIPLGFNAHNIELNPGRGGQIVRSAGSSAEILAHEQGFTHIKMPSGEIRKVLSGNFASIGQVSNPDNNLVVIGKAGRSRQMGIRPTVRGTAMNPVDHPYGGGEGRQPRGTRKPKTMWGKITGGHKTRNRKKWSNKLIISRRINKKKK
ncbi:MAG: 50S ribosomal protein L2 [Candidatus Colwellbacteria bacterium]|nr:50S ribosomal protein L2 [Candidatus Colwellbacteria bacterium]